MSVLFYVGQIMNEHYKIVRDIDLIQENPDASVRLHELKWRYEIYWSRLSGAEHGAFGQIFLEIPQGAQFLQERTRHLSELDAVFAALERAGSQAGHTVDEEITRLKDAIDGFRPALQDLQNGVYQYFLAEGQAEGQDYVVRRAFMESALVVLLLCQFAVLGGILILIVVQERVRRRREAALAEQLDDTGRGVSRERERAVFVLGNLEAGRLYFDRLRRQSAEDIRHLVRLAAESAGPDGKNGEKNDAGAISAAFEDVSKAVDADLLDMRALSDFLTALLSPVRKRAVSMHEIVAEMQARARPFVSHDMQLAVIDEASPAVIEADLLLGALFLRYVMACAHDMEAGTPHGRLVIGLIKGEGIRQQGISLTYVSPSLRESAGKDLLLAFADPKRTLGRHVHRRAFFLTICRIIAERHGSRMAIGVPTDKGFRVEIHFS